MNGCSHPAASLLPDLMSSAIMAGAIAYVPATCGLCNEKLRVLRSGDVVSEDHGGSVPVVMEATVPTAVTPSNSARNENRQVFGRLRYPESTPS